MCCAYSVWYHLAGLPIVLPGWLPILCRSCRRLMTMYHLLRTEYATRAQERGGWLAPLIEPGLHGGLECLPLVRPAVEVQDLGVELAPDLLDRIAPRRVGRH